MNNSGIYAIIQFRPYTLTEEFVNIGVALACDKLNYFDYQLMGSEGIDRISNFFYGYDMNVYTSGLLDYIDELNLLKTASYFKTRNEIVKHMTRPLESTFKCNQNIGAVIIADNDPDQTLNLLFQNHIAKFFKRKHS